MNGGAGVVRIPVRIIPKGVLSFRAKWCADFSNTPLLTCGFVVFRVGVWNSALCEILFPLNSNESKIRAVLCRLAASLSRSSLQGESFCDQARRLQNALSAPVLPDSRLIPWRLIPYLRRGVAVGGAQRARTPSLIRQSGDVNHAPSEASSLPSIRSERRKTFFLWDN